MNQLDVRNVHCALPVAVRVLGHVGVRRETRNGQVLQTKDPVTTVYHRPLERVLFHPERDANPFFHLYESLWMLAGRDDVAPLAKMVPRMRSFSDDGETLHGAYGKRWRDWFTCFHEDADYFSPFDQLKQIADALKRNPDCRRQVLQMWDAESDLGRYVVHPDTGIRSPGRDVPCNLMATFQVNVDRELDMVVFNRSNDIVWGCYGANAVHFSYLLEYVAARIGIAVGKYTQVSVNWHGYVDTLDPLLATWKDQLADDVCPYEQGRVKPFPLMEKGTDPDKWDAELRDFLDGRGRVAWSPFFFRIAAPMFNAHRVYKEFTDKDLGVEAATAWLRNMPEDNDWRLAAEEWLERRRIRYLKEMDDGPAAG